MLSAPLAISKGLAMLEDASAHENVIAVSFSAHANAYEALSRLKEVDARGDAGVRGAAVVERGEDGKIVTKDEFGEESVEGTVSGGLLGLLMGVIGGPFGVLVGGASGVLIISMLPSGSEPVYLRLQTTYALCGCRCKHLRPVTPRRPSSA